MGHQVVYRFGFLQSNSVLILGFVGVKMTDYVVIIAKDFSITYVPIHRTSGKTFPDLWWSVLGWSV